MTTEPDTLHCLACRAEFRPARRGTVHFCLDCREDRRRTQDRRYKLASAQRRKDIVEAALARLDDPRERRALVERAKRLSNEAWQRVIGAGDWLLSSTAQAGGEVHQWRPLPGARTIRGPEMGHSTEIEDVAELLRARADEAAEHPWWRDNPHWAFELDDRAAARRYLPLSTCGDARGTRAGYKRHRHAGEMACPACTTANSEYVRDSRAA